MSYLFKRWSSVYQFCVKELGMKNLAEEEVYLFALNAGLRVVGVFMLSKGTVSCAAVGCREIFVRALLIGAVRVILAHNHPSGDFTPSAEDVFVTKEVKKAGELLQINLLDHIIVGACGYYSFEEKRNSEHRT